MADAGDYVDADRFFGSESNTTPDCDDGIKDRTITAGKRPYESVRIRNSIPTADKPDF